MSADIGRVALVTGAAGGIGAAIAARLARDGLAVAIVDRKPASTQVDAIRAAGGHVTAFSCDLTDPSAIDALGRDVLDAMGRVDVLVNNAGRYDTLPFAQMDFTRWRDVMALNLDAMFLTAKAFVPDMQARGWGRIIHIASNSLFLPVPGMAAYIASKAGAIGLARALATEFAPDGITANVVAPGPIVTEQLRHAFATDFSTADPAAFDGFLSAITQMQAIKRAGTPDEVAGVVSFLAGDDSRFMTGQTLVADGGYARL